MTSRILWFAVVLVALAGSRAVAAPQAAAQMPAERRSVSVPMVTERWSATATSTPPAPQKSLRFIGHMPGFTEAKQAANQRAAQNRPNQTISPAPRALSQPLAGPAPLNGPGSILTFEGPSESDTQYIPPDPQIAAGPNHLVVAINSLLAIYDKSGNKIGGYQDLGTFFASLGITGDIFDPRLIFDQVDGRFILSVADVDMTNFTSGHVLLAVSQTSDPTGAWYKYALDFTGISPYTGRFTFPDFPGLGLNVNNLYVTTNQFEMNAACLAANPTEPCYFTDAWIKAIGLAELLSGNPNLNVVTFKNIHTASNQLAFSLQPAVTYGSPGYEFFVAASFSANPGTVLDLFAFTSFGTPTLDAAELNVAPFFLPPDAPQAGSSKLIATNDFRTLNAVWANGSLWVTQNIGSPNVALARFYEIQLSDLATANLVQLDDVGASGEAYYPAISVKPDGTVVMAFTTSNSSLPAAAAFTGKPAGGPPSMQGFAIYRQGTDPYDEPRWGDYSGISVDPDGSSFWTIAEYAGSSNPHFGTAIAQISSPPSLTISPVGLNFDPTKVGSQSSPQTLTFQNAGNDPITLGALQKIGPNASDFPSTSDLCSGVVLSPGQSCTVSLIFKPSQQTSESAYVALSGGGMTVTGLLAGFGLAPDLIVFSPPSIVFPPTAQQTASAPQVVTLTNVGAYDLSFFFQQISQPFIQTNNCPSPLAAGASCQMSIVFRPTSAGNFSGFVQIFTGAEFYSASLSGTGVSAPDSVLCPPSVDFGNQVQGTPSTAQPVVLTNTGSAQLTITGIATAGDFSETDNCVGSLPPRTNCTVQVTFTPSALGVRHGAITINDNASGSPQTISLAGTGIVQGTQIAPEAPPVIASLQQNAAALAEAQHRILHAERPISFEPNQGQFPEEVQFVAHLPGYAMAFTPGEVRLRFPRGQTGEPVEAAIALAEANRQASPLGIEELPGRANYFFGNDPAQWRRDIPMYSRVKLEEVYPGVDLVYYGTDRQLEYDFLIAPGANPKHIRLKFDRDSRLSVSPTGDLLVSTAAGTMQLHKPVVYQYGQDRSVEAREYRDGRWVVKGSSTAAFKLGHYDHGRALVIDPVLSFSTYFGASGGDEALAVAVDAAGNAYLAGGTSSHDFPVTPNAIKKTCSIENYGCESAFVAKFSADGSTLMYSTYLGGQISPSSEIHAIAVDSSGSAYVTGSTVDADFPTTPNAFQTSPQSAFVTKLDPTGSSLVYSTYLDANVGAGIAVDSQGEAYVTGATYSANFPVTAGAFQSRPPAPLSSNAFVTKFNPAGSGLVFSTYLGGVGGNDVANAIAVDPSGNAYVTGQAVSLDFPTTPGAFQTGSYGGDAFVAKFTSSGSIVYSTLLGGEVDFFGHGTNIGKGIAADSSGAAYVTGTNGIGGFPVTPGAFITTKKYANSSGFLAKLHPQGCALSYGTYTQTDDSRAIALDLAGDAYVAGAIGSNGGAALPTTPQVPGVNAVQPAVSTFYGQISEFDATGSSLLFSTPIGSAGFPSAIALDSNGGILVAGNTRGLDLPNANAIQPDCELCNTNRGGMGPILSGTAFLAKIGLNQAATGVSLTRADVTFSTQPAAYGPQARTVGLMNNLAVPLNIQSVTVSDPAYSLSLNACAGSVMPGAGCAITIQYPGGAGAPPPATLTMIDDGPGSPRQVAINTPKLLSVTLRGSGSGTITSDPPGINCGTTCSAQFAAGTVVTLTAIPAAGSALSSWDWAGCVLYGSPCSIQLTGNTMVRAFFVNSSNHLPQGAVDQLVNANTNLNSIPPGGTLLVSGWAVDMDSGAPVGEVQVQVDGKVLGSATLGQPRLDVAAYYNRPDFLNSGWTFKGSIGNISPGVHSVSVWAYDADSPASSTPIGNNNTWMWISVGSNPPQGAVDRAVNANNTASTSLLPGGTLLVSGWAMDLDSPAPVAQVTVNVDGAPLGNATLGQARSDVAKYFKSNAFLNSGWSLSAPIGNLALGKHTVTVVAYDADTQGVSATIGSPLTFTVANSLPQGAVDQATNANNVGSSIIPPGGSLLVSGWTIDLDSPAPVKQVTVYIDGAPFGNATLGQPRSDVANYYQRPDLLNSGWSLSAPLGNLALGNHTVTVVASDADTPGASATIGDPLPFTVGYAGNHAPQGAVDQATNGNNYGSSIIPPGGTLLVSGWTIDMDSPAPVAQVTVYIDGTPFGNATLGQPRSDVANYYKRPDLLNSGWSLSAPIGNLPLGNHTVTVVAYDADAAGVSAPIGNPLTITVGYAGNHAPQGSVDRAVNANNNSTNIIPPGGTLLVTGWAVDMDSPAPVGQVTVNIDGVAFGNATLGQPRSDVANYYNRSNLLNSGWSLSAPIGNLALGDHTVTVVAYDADAAGVSATIGKPLTITVGYAGNHAPQGAVDTATNANNYGSSILPPGGTLLVSGWTIDMDSPAPVGQVAVYIDGVAFGNATLGQPRSDVANYYNRPDLLNSGWSLRAPLPSLAAGDHTVTVVASDADAPGVTAPIGSPLTIAVGYAGNHVPQGAVDVATNANNYGSSVIPPGGTLLVSGWTIDLDGPAPVAQVSVYIDGVALGNATLGQPRSDVASYYERPDLLNSGWSLAAPIGNLAAGNHTVTVVAYDADAPGVWVPIGPSFTITVSGP